MSEQTPETPAAPAETPGPESDPPVPAPQDDDDDAEAEEQAGEVEGEPEPDEEATPEMHAVLDDRELEKRFKRIETAHNTYSRKLSEIMGEEAQALEPCPRCAHGIPAFIFPFAPVSPEVKARVLISMGDAPPEASKQDPYTQTCATCDGQGSTLSGSHTTRDKAITCIDCDGKGYTLVGDRRNQVAQALLASRANAEPAAAGNGIADVAEQPPELDPWGRPPADPDYGRMPMYATRR